MNRIYNKILLVTASMLIAVGIMIPAGHADASVFKEVGAAETVGAPIQQVAVFDSVYGVENGRDVLYATSVGNPAMFNVLDLDSNELIRAIPLPEGKSSWTHTVAPDGRVYIGVSDGGPLLMRYDPATATIENLGMAVSGAASIWSLTTDEAGNVYGGTFQTGRVFQYNPATDTFRDYGVMVAGREYVRSIAYSNGYVYAGIGSEGAIIKLDVVTGDKTEIPLKAVQGVSGAYPFVYGLDVRGNYLFAFLSGGNTAAYIIYDLANEQWLDNNEYHGVTGLKVSPVHNNKVYFVQSGMLMEWDLDTQAATSTGIAQTTSLRGSAWVTLEEDGQFANPVLVTVAYAGSTIYMDVAGKRRVVKPNVMQGSALSLQALEMGPDGNLYISGYTASNGAIYNPTTDTFTTIALGQSESIGSSDDLVYFGNYPGAEIAVFDTTKPVSATNPKILLHIGEDQDRPYVNTFAEGKAFFGTIPGYGQTGGALVVFEEADPVNTLQVHRHVVKDQSIVGLAYKDGLIYGSTSIKGGLDGNWPAANAKMFIWDVEKQQKIAEWEPQIPGVKAAPIFISGLTFDKDGLLWAVADGHIFAMNPATQEIVKSLSIYPNVTDYGQWRPIHIRFGSDGMIYTDITAKLVIVDPEKMEYLETGINTALFTLDSEDTIYYVDGGTLVKRTVHEMQYIPPGSLKLTAPTRVEPGATFNVAINASQAKQMYSGDLVIEYDAGTVKLDGVSAGSAFTSTPFIDYRIDNTLGKARILFSETGAAGMSTDGEVLLLHFTAKDAIAAANITLKSTSKIAAVHSSTSNIMYNLLQDEKVNVSLKKRTDVNGNGVVDEIDLVTVAKRVGQSSFNSDYDVNGDGRIDIVDVSLIALELIK